MTFLNIQILIILRLFYFLQTLKKPLLWISHFSLCNSDRIWLWPKFYPMVETFLNDCESCVMNNGHSGGFFPIK